MALLLSQQGAAGAITGTGTGSLSPDGSAIGTFGNIATASGLLQPSGAASASHGVSSSAAGSLSPIGSAAGVQGVIGTASSNTSPTGSAAGVQAALGSAFGVLLPVAVATGSSDAPTVIGTGAGISITLAEGIGLIGLAGYGFGEVSPWGSSNGTVLMQSALPAKEGIEVWFVSSYRG